jgi:hypothetical protein
MFNTIPPPPKLEKILVAHGNPEKKMFDFIVLRSEPSACVLDGTCLFLAEVHTLYAEVVLTII